MAKGIDICSKIRIVQFFALFGIVFIITHQINLNLVHNGFDLLAILIFTGIITFIFIYIVNWKTNKQSLRNSSAR